MYTKRNYRNKRNKLHLSYNVIKNEQYLYIFHQIFGLP